MGDIYNIIAHTDMINSRDIREEPGYFISNALYSRALPLIGKGPYPHGEGPKSIRPKRHARDDYAW